MARFKKGQKIYQVVGYMHELMGAYDKSVKKHEYTIKFGRIKEVIVEGCGQKRLILYGDKDQSYSPEGSISYVGMEPVLQFYNTKEEALEALKQYGRNEYANFEYRKGCEYGAWTKKFMYVIVPENYFRG